MPMLEMKDKNHRIEGLQGQGELQLGLKTHPRDTLVMAVWSWYAAGFLSP